MASEVNQISQMQMQMDQSRIVTILSGKGGVGKSVIAVNLSIALAKQNKRVILVDGDTNLANIDVILGINPRYTILHHMLDDVPLEKVLYKHSAGFELLANVSGDYNWQDIGTSIKTRLVRLLMSLKASAEYVVIDTATGLSPLTIDFAAYSDNILVVTTSEATAMSDSYAMIKILTSIDVNGEIALVHNMVTNPCEVAEKYQRLSLVLNHFLDTEIDMAGYIEFDERIRDSVETHHPFLLAHPDAPASRSLERIAENLIKSNELVLEKKAS